MKKQQYETNKEYVAARQKKYNQQNKECVAARQKKYKEQNKARLAARAAEAVTCGCGSVVQRTFLSGHAKTKKHQQYLNTLQENDGTHASEEDKGAEASGAWDVRERQQVVAEQGELNAWESTGGHGPGQAAR